ncbi:MAG: thioredoxin-disulfide reductase [Clostridiales bacterium]|nr:thioredoxin-disulfide reductase [Clostridiales bacterium]
MAAVHINHERFNELMKGNKPVLVDFWAPWCTYCRRISDAYDRIAEQYAGKLEVVKVNIDDNEALAIQEKIEIIPTLVLYQGGEAAGSIVAPESKAMIESFIGETMPEEEKKEEAHIYDMVIVGGGPGGYTAALYAARAGLDVVVIEKLSAGGQMAQTHQIDNYPGFVEGIDGFELAQNMLNQAHRFGAKTVYAEVTQLELSASPKKVHTSEGVFYGRTVVLATGAGPRELGIDKERELVGRGVAYCAACDGMFFKDKTVVVVGGGNSAAADALLLSRVASKVILVHRRDSLRATKIYHEPLEKAENVEFRWDSVVQELLHGEKLTGVKLRNVKTGEESKIDCDGVFVSVGRKPASQLAAGQLDIDKGGYIIADETTRTSLPGVYAVGDVRTKLLRQVVTAVADGAMAVHMAEEYLAGDR